MLRALETGAHSPCQYTDDTQLARTLLLSATTTTEASGKPVFDVVDFAQQASALYASHKMVGCGMGTAKALSRIAGGVALDSAARAGDAGNGAAVRSWVMALIAHDREFAVSAAVEQARVTHSDGRALATSAAVATVAFGLMRVAAPLDEANASALLAAAVESARPWNVRVADALAALPSSRRLPPTEFVAMLQREYPAKGGERPDGVSGYCLPTVLWSLYCFLRHPDDFLAAMVCCLRVGGDTDSTCALVGALSGAHLGVRAARLPEALATRLHDQGEWGHDELVRLASRAWDAWPVGQ